MRNVHVRQFVRAVAVAFVALTVQATSGAGTHQITIQNFDYTPFELRIQAGDTVTWINTDPFGHNTVSDTGVWASNNLARGQSFSYRFDTPGVYPYYCSYHPSMRATVVVAAVAVELRLFLPAVSGPVL
jgi:plastocyanin